MFSFFFKKDVELDERLLNIIVCPISKKPLTFDKKNQMLVQEEEGLAYQVVDGIPILDPSRVYSIHEQE